MFKHAVGDVVTAAEYNTIERVYFRFTSGTTVLNTVTETDLLGGGLTIAAGDMGTTGLVRLTMWGDFANNSGAARDTPKFRVKLGAGPSTALDTNTGASGTGFAASASTFPWRAVVEIQNLGLTNAQSVNIDLRMTGSNVATVEQTAVFTTGSGVFQQRGQIAQAIGGSPGVGIDTTVAMAIQFTVINATATATYQTRLFNAVAELL